MSGDFHGPISEFAKIFAQHAALPPPQKAQARTSWGTLILCACAVTAYELGPDALNQYPPWALYSFCGAAGFGVLLLIVGLRSPRAPAEFMTYVGSLFWLAVFSAGSWALSVHLPEWWDSYIWLRIFCLSFTAGFALEFLLLLFRPAAGNAEGMVKDHIDRNRVDMRPANGRR